MFTTSVLIASFAIATLQAPTMIVPVAFDTKMAVVPQPATNEPVFILDRVSIGEDEYYSVTLRRAAPAGNEVSNNVPVNCYMRMRASDQTDEMPLMCYADGLPAASSQLLVKVQRPVSRRPWNDGVNFLFNWA